MKTPESPPSIKVLMYHRVTEHPVAHESRWHYVTTDAFRKQVHLIDKLGFTTITFVDYQLYLQGELSLPAKPIILTFDDGYLDTYEIAAPILMEYGMRAVVFVMGDRHLTRATWDETGDNDPCPLMSDSQCRTLRKLGFEIGAHSMTHNDLTRLSSREVLHEAERSKQEIEWMLGEPIHTFSYPYGRVDDRIQSIIQLAGYAQACGVYSGSARFGESLMDIRRLAIHHHHSRFQLWLRLATPFEQLEWLYHRMKTRTNGSRKSERPLHPRKASATQTIHNH